MTPLAIAEAEIAAECSPAGVAGRAGLGPSRREVLGRGGRTHLPRLRRARGDFVAIGTRESLARAVVRVTERVAISARVRARRAIRFLFVTDSARTELASGV